MNLPALVPDFITINMPLTILKKLRTAFNYLSIGLFTEFPAAEVRFTPARTLVPTAVPLRTWAICFRSARLNSTEYVFKLKLTDHAVGIMVAAPLDSIIMQRFLQQDSPALPNQNPERPNIVLQSNSAQRCRCHRQNYNVAYLLPSMNLINRTF